MKEDYKEYNLLTKRLLEEGYSAEHHPDHVRVGVFSLLEILYKHAGASSGSCAGWRSHVAGENP